MGYLIIAIHYGILAAIALVQKAAGKGAGRGVAAHAVQGA